MDAVEQASQVMLALPISDELKGIARYYEALCVKHQGDFDKARHSLERVVEEAIPQYRARVLLSIAATHYDTGNISEAALVYLEAGKVALNTDTLTATQSAWQTAIIKSIHGDHRQALEDLEKLFPLVRTIAKHYPVLYYNYLNSLAVELGEVGRIAEAEAALSIALASPFASAYPEWIETRNEIAAKRQTASPSTVAFNRAPETDLSAQAEPQRNAKSKAIALYWPAGKQPSYAALVGIPATAVISCQRTVQPTLERLGKCTKPRAPPARRQTNR
ncbi:MAG TPA: hypothetical protein VNN73_17020 [Blastocatellia bacterium]|nr:hypothetical protein [Blastocatellia bacterium]